MSDRPDVVIAGAGIAAGNAAFALRRQGFSGRITIVGEEHYAPYQRPPLSKSYLAGEASVESLYARSASDYDKARVELISGTRVEQIDRHSKRVLLSNGLSIEYGSLVLALGGRARLLNSLWSGLPGSISNLHAIRTIDDVDRLSLQFKPEAKLVIVGGGYIGLEVAAVAVRRGLHVCVLERLPRVLARVTSPEVSSFYESIHRNAGVDILTGVEIVDFELDSATGSIRAVHCSDGKVVPSDVVIAGIGMVPSTELARSAGLEIGDGILVDANCRTSDHDIFAIGDCSNFPYALTGERVRLESVPNAMEQARTAAASICEKERPHTAIPWFWSDQYDLKLQIVGLLAGYERAVVRGAMNARRFSVFYLRKDRIIAIDAVNSPEDIVAARMLISAQTEVDPIQLSDTSIALTALTTRI